MFNVAVAADTHITCKSKDYHQTNCKLDRPGHVRLSKQISTRTRRGFVTNQHGDRSNEVSYHRVN